MNGVGDALACDRHDTEGRDHTTLDARLFSELANDGRLGRLAGLDAAARQRPLAEGGGAPATDEQHPTTRLVEDHRTGGDDDARFGLR